MLAIAYEEILDILIRKAAPRICHNRQIMKERLIEYRVALHIG